MVARDQTWMLYHASGTTTNIEETRVWRTVWTELTVVRTVGCSTRLTCVEFSPHATASLVERNAGMGTPGANEFQFLNASWSPTERSLKGMLSRTRMVPL